MIKNNKKNIKKINFKFFKPKSAYTHTMSSFLMSYPHVQGSMGSGYEPKFPPSETDFHHLHHHHSGYGAMNGLAANHVDYTYHNHNGYNYGNYTPTPTTPFYHHPHPPYGSPQMHHPANASSPNHLTTQQTNSSYVTNLISSNNNNNSSNNDHIGIGSVSGGTRNNIVVPSTTGITSIPVQSLVNGLNVSESSPNVDNSIGYYNNYYATTNGHHNPQDLPLQCPTNEPPANTALGLQELGNFFS